MDLFTYQSLSTLTGAVTATVLTTEFCKLIWPGKGTSTRWMALLIAEGVVLISNIASSSFSMNNIPLYFFNGLLVASSAMGSWQVVHDLVSNGANGGKEA